MIYYKYYMAPKDEMYEHIDDISKEDVIDSLDYAIRVKHFDGSILLIEHNTDLGYEYPFYVYKGNEQRYVKEDRDTLLERLEPKIKRR